MGQKATSLRTIGTQTEILEGGTHFATEYDKKPGSSGNGDILKDLNATTESSVQSQDHFILLNNLPAAAAVISISKIRSKILSYSSPQDLLNFRLVSHQWRLDATNSTLLQWERNSIKIVMNQTLSGQDVFAENSNRNLKVPIEELSALLLKTGMNPFPCNQFYINFTNESETCIGKASAFFREHGSRVVALTLFVSYYVTCGGYSRCSHNEFWLKKFCVDQIVRQLPNLETFFIYPSTLQSLSHSEILCNFNITKLCKNAVSNVNYKLNSINILGDVSELFLESVCASAPNLKQLELIGLKFYLEPKNRLHLLKKIRYDISTHSDYEYYDAERDEIIKRIANNADETLQLTELYIYFTRIHQPSEAWLEEVAETCNKLLEKSCRSLKKLEWAPLGFLPGLIIPHMPNITYICFGTGMSSSPDGRFFPQDIFIAETFPNLRTIEIRGRFDKDWFKYGDLLRLGCQVVPSVKEIINKSNVILNGIQQWFSNAKVIS